MVGSRSDGDRDDLEEIIRRMYSFVCYNCNVSTEKYKDKIHHLCETQKSKCLTNKELKLDYSTGQLAYRKKLCENVTQVTLQ